MDLTQAVINSLKRDIEFGTGFLEGFFLDGAWGTVTGLWGLVKGGFSFGVDYIAYDMAFKYDLVFGTRIAENTEFAGRIQDGIQTAQKFKQAINQGGPYAQAVYDDLDICILRPKISSRKKNDGQSSAR